MRRKDREITDVNEIEKILKTAEVIRIAMIDGDEPYIVALNYAYENGIIYIHSANEGRKLDVIRKNSKVAFQVDSDIALQMRSEDHKCTTFYKSVVGVGKALITNEKSEKILALDSLMRKHSHKEVFNYPEQVLDMTLIIKIEVDSKTGKKNGY